MDEIHDETASGGACSTGGLDLEVCVLRRLLARSFLLYSA